MAEFILSTFVILMMLSKKLFFFRLEPEYFVSSWGIAEFLGFSLLFILGFWIYIKEKLSSKNRKRKKLVSTKINISFMAIVFLVITSFVILITVYLNSIKVSLHWDAIALYDARAIFLENGTKFSEMPILSEYDNLNKYYYLLYPPYTSIAHYFWRQVELFSQFPVGLYYSVVLLLMVALVFLLTKRTLGITGSALLVLLISSNSSIINIVVKEYTNLPYSLHIVVGSFLLFSFLNTKQRWRLFYGIFLISTSIWIRLLEPMWLPVIVALGITLFSRKKIIISQAPAVLLLFFCLLQYFSWSFFTKVIGNNPTAIEVAKHGFYEPIIGVFTGAPWVVLRVFVEAWGLPLFIHLSTLLALILGWKYVIKNKDILFLGFILVFSILLYFIQFYFLSFQVDWWDIVAKSLDRSSAFLIPISAYLVIRMIREYQYNTKKN